MNFIELKNIEIKENCGKQIDNKSQSKAQFKNAFISKSQRFTKKIDQLPGPGSYDCTIKEHHTQDFHRNSQQNTQQKNSNVRLQHQWIFSNTRFNFGLPQNSLGPGSYNILLKQQNHSSWSKTERFNQRPSQSHISPFSYNALNFKSLQKKQALSPVFRSRSPKSFLDKIYKKPETELKMVQTLDPQIEQLQKLSSTFQQKQEHHLPKKPQAMFASKIQRCTLLNQHSTDKLGPGAYHLEAVPSKPTKRLQPVKSLSKNYHQIPSMKVTPGPGSYNVEAFEHDSPFGVISKEERFGRQKQSMIPGPGQYMQNKFMFVNQPTSKKYKAIPKQIFSVSKEQRTNFVSKTDTPFGDYNANISDIQYRAKKQKRHLDRLKFLEVEIPAFSSRLNRFS